MWLLDLLFRYNSSIKSMEARRDIKGLARVLKYRRDSATRAKAARVLGVIGDTRSVVPLMRSLKDPDRSVRFTAAESLGRIGDAKAVEQLAEALTDKDWYVRLHAAAALGDIGDSRAVEPLTQALKDEEKAVREWSARAPWEYTRFKGAGTIDSSFGRQRRFRQGRRQGCSG
jgi:HEAT repeat protein